MRVFAHVFRSGGAPDRIKVRTLMWLKLRCNFREAPMLLCFIARQEAVATLSQKSGVTPENARLPHAQAVTLCSDRMTASGECMAEVVDGGQSVKPPIVADKVMPVADLPQVKGLSIAPKLFLISTALLIVIGPLATVWDYYVGIAQRGDAFSIATLLAMAIGALAFAGIVIRELRALSRLHRVTRMREMETRIYNDSDPDNRTRKTAAQRLLRSFDTRYMRSLNWQEQNNAKTKLHELESASPVDIVDGLRVHVLAPLDQKVLRIIRRNAARVGIATSVSPFPIFDSLTVAYLNLRMIREIGEVYQARPGIGSSLRMLLGYSASVGAAGLFGKTLEHLQSRANIGMVAFLLGHVAKGTANLAISTTIGLQTAGHLRPLAFTKEDELGLMDVSALGATKEKLASVAAALKAVPAKAKRGIPARLWPWSGSKTKAV